MEDKKAVSALRKAIVLLSGGLDSAVTLYIAKHRGFFCHCLIFDYGQRHKKEIESAKRIARAAACRCQVLKIDLPWKGSSLLDRKIRIPHRIAARKSKGVNIPSTYVPGRNIVFLSFAVSFAEAVGASAIFIGAHMQDYSDYPDCREDFFNAFKKIIKTGTRSGVEKEEISIQAPLISKRKSEIIKSGLRLKVPFELTWSCYRGRGKPCGRCDSCYFRAKGFAEAGIPDPLLDFRRRRPPAGRVGNSFG